MADDGESLESWLNKATNPSNRREDWEYIMGFCDQINKELEGPQISVRLLAHKIQSPQEWEAIQALMVLEACMKNCGQRFHNEVGKFRFLNELIKVVSPKYLGDKVSEKVKSKVIEMIYSWTVSLPDETKICEAYQMLKSQGIILVDPEIPLDVTLIPPPSPQAKNPVFDDEKRSKRLAELLKSKKPEDLQEANRLIKNMVKEDEVRTQKVRKQKSTLEAVNNSVKLLNEMLAHFSSEDSTDSDKELIGELYNDCDKLRQTVFQLATESEDNDSSLGDILQASDDLSHVINSYKKIVKGQDINGETEEAQQTSGKQDSGNTNSSEILIDLVGIDVQSPSTPENQPPASFQAFPTDLLSGTAATQPQSKSPSAIPGALSLLDEELLSLGLNDPVESTGHVEQSKHSSSFHDPSQDMHLFNTTLLLGPTTSPYSLCPNALSSSVAPFSPNKFSSAASPLSFSKPVFQTSPVITEAFATTSVMFPQPLSSTLITSAQTVLSSSLSMSLPAPSVMQVPTSLTAPHSLSTSVNKNLQDLSLLDLGSPKNPGVSSPTSNSLLIGQMQGGSNIPSVKSQEDDCPLLHSDSPMHPLTHASQGRGQDISLADVFVPLDAIRSNSYEGQCNCTLTGKTAVKGEEQFLFTSNMVTTEEQLSQGNMCPVTAYDKNGVRVLLHFASDCPPGRPDVLVMVVTMLNTAPQPVRSIVLQAAVPKTMKVRLQPPSGTELAPFNPILPPAAITQVLLLANPLKEKVRMRYKLIFTFGEQLLTEVGEVNEFPPADRWGAL